MTAPSQRTKGLLMLAAALLAALAWGFWPRAAPVETAQATRGPLAVTVEEEARTGVKERYVLHAPVAGQLRRIELKVGDPAPAEGVLARLGPAPPTALHPPRPA